MAVKLSAQGLSFIKSWSLFSETPFTVLQLGETNLLIGYFYYGSEIPYKPYNPIVKTDSTSEEDASIVFEKELLYPSFKLFDDFGLDGLSQQQFDALVSICTTYRTYDYYSRLKNSEVFNAIKNGESPATVASLILTELPISPEVSSNPKKYGVFYDLDIRREHEANLYLNGVYDPCPGLSFTTEVIDGIKIFS